jgi:hypothetical protein
MALVAVPGWPLTRVAPPVIGAAALVPIAGDPAALDDPAVAALAAGALLAQALAGLVEVDGRYPLRPAQVRHAAVPGLAAWLAVELVELAEPAVQSPALDEEALQSLAALLVVIAYLGWLLRRPATAPAPLTGRARVAVGDGLLPVTVSLAALIALIAVRPASHLSPEVEGLLVAAAGLAVHLARSTRSWWRNSLATRLSLRDVVAAGSATAVGLYGLAAGTAAPWVAGLTFVVGGIWGLAVAVLVRGPLAGPWPGSDRGRGWIAVRIGSALAGVGYLRLLTAGDDIVVEAVVLPVGAVLLAFGVAAMRVVPAPGDARPGSLRALLPGLLLASAPSACLAVVDPEGWRPVLVGAAGGGLAVIGALLRWQAPLLVGGVVAVPVAVVQAFPLVRSLPEWVALGVVGALALGLGATFEEQRRRARAVGRTWRGLR